MLPREVFACRPQKPPSRSKVSRFGTSESNDSWAAASPSAGKKRSKPPLSRNIRSCSFVSRLGRRQHQQQHAQVPGNVPRAESAGLLQHQGPAGGGQIELPTVRVVTILQRLQGLAVESAWSGRSNSTSPVCRRR